MWRNTVSICRVNQNAEAFSSVISANRRIMWFTDQVNYFQGVWHIFNYKICKDEMETRCAYFFMAAELFLWKSTCFY